MATSRAKVRTTVPDRVGPERLGPERLGPERLGPERRGVVTALAALLVLAGSVMASATELPSGLTWAVDAQAQAQVQAQTQAQTQAEPQVRTPQEGNGLRIVTQQELQRLIRERRESNRQEKTRKGGEEEKAKPPQAAVPRHRETYFERLMARGVLMVPPAGESGPPQD